MTWKVAHFQWVQCWICPAQIDEYEHHIIVNNSLRSQSLRSQSTTALRSQPTTASRSQSTKALRSQSTHSADGDTHKRIHRGCTEHAQKIHRRSHRAHHRDLTPITIDIRSNVQRSEQWPTQWEHMKTTPDQHNTEQQSVQPCPNR